MWRRCAARVDRAAPEPLGERMLAAPASGIVSEPLEDDSVQCSRRLDEALDHRESRAPTDRLRMHAEVEDAARDVAVCPLELGEPDLVDARRRILPSGHTRDELEVLEVAQRPRERDPDEIDAFAELVLGLGCKRVARS